MKHIPVKSILIGILSFLVCINLYKSISLYSHPDSPYDARNIFLAGKMWLKHQNPYNDSLLKLEWQQTASFYDIASTKAPGFKDCGMIYPFWSIPMLYPYFASIWPISKLLILFLSGIFLLTLAYFTYKSFAEVGLSFALCLLILLAFKSSLIAVALGQPLLMSMASIMVSWYFYQKNKDTLSGLFLGVAFVKITLCLPFVLLFMLSKKWKLLAYSALIPVMGALVFYSQAGHFYWAEMAQNINQQMQINYAGHTITAVNTNLTELGILLNYFGGVSYSFLSIFNPSMIIIGSLGLMWCYSKNYMNAAELLALLIVWHFLFSYHLIYDCILLIFLIPLFKNRRMFNWVWMLLLCPLFLPINGIFKSIAWIHFHLPIALLSLFLNLVYVCYRNHTIRAL